MKAIIFNKYGGPEVLEYVDVVTPKPGKNEILVKMKTASVNPADWKVRKGKLKFITGNKFPISIGIEGAGIVESVGQNVYECAPGQRVFIRGKYTAGTYAEYIVVPSANAVILPDEISFEEGSSLAVAGVTAYQAFTYHAGIEEGMHVLVNGASGGLGTYAIQIAKILGATVTAVCSEKNADLVLSLGADIVLDYAKEDFNQQNNSYDIIIDSAGTTSFNKAKKSMKKGGMLIKLNISFKTLFDQFVGSLFSSKRVKLVLLKDNNEDVKWVRDQIALKNIKVIIDKVFNLKDARKAHEYSETLRARGKIILKVD